MRTGERRRGSPQPTWTALPVLVVLAGVLPLLLRYVVRPDDVRWMIDLDVYRQAGQSVLAGRPVYEHLTAAPQYLPFTYPPFAALLAIPLALLPFRVVGVFWFVAQVLAAAALVRVVGGRLLARAGERAPLAWAALTVLLLHALPAADGLRYGQVNAFLVLMVALDLLRPRLPGLDRVPRGVLIGLATAIKLTPGLFLVHLLLTRRWREAATGIATAAGVTLATFVLLPQASFAFWGGALNDPERLGRNDATANQSIRGVLLRLLPAWPGRDVLWLLLAAAVAVVGLHAAARATARGDELMAFATVGTTAVLVSPVSWIHHLHWLLPALVVLAAPDRGSVPLRAHPRRLVGVALLWLMLWQPLPRWGQWRLTDDPVFEPATAGHHPLWLLLNNSYAVLALVILLALAGRSRAGDGPPRRPAPSVPGQRPARS